MATEGRDGSRLWTKVKITSQERKEEASQVSQSVVKKVQNKTCSREQCERRGACSDQGSEGVPKKTEMDLRFFGHTKSER
jgi:CRISPR/Cas system Type II protein with McrA/HNH and RuvC-like nuclease domain